MNPAACVHTHLHHCCMCAHTTHSTACRVFCLACCRGGDPGAQVVADAGLPATREHRLLSWAGEMEAQVSLVCVAAACTGLRVQLQRGKGSANSQPPLTACATWQALVVPGHLRSDKCDTSPSRCSL